MLTTKQLQIFNFIAERLYNAGNSPTLKTIQTNLGYKDHITVFHTIERIIAKGYLKKDPNKAQSISIVKYPPGATNPKLGLAIFNPEQDTIARMAYARGVASERARLLGNPDAITAAAIKKAYDNGFIAGKTYKSRAEADEFARGQASARAERSRLLSKAYEDGYAACARDHGLTPAQKRAG